MVKGMHAVHVHVDDVHFEVVVRQFLRQALSAGARVAFLQPEPQASSVRAQVRDMGPDAGPAVVEVAPARDTAEVRRVTKAAVAEALRAGH